MLRDDAEKRRKQDGQEGIVAEAGGSLLCPICRNAARHLNTPSLFELRRCSACQAVFLDTSPQRMIDYASELEQQFFGAEFVAKDSNWVARYETWNSQRILRRLPQADSSGKRYLLEVGIGSGRFLKNAAQAGWQVAGIEASSLIAEHVQQQYGIPVFVGGLDDYDDSLGAGFDVVVMNHVLEHIADPKKALLRIKSLLKSDGLLHLTVPNLDCWEAKLPGWTSYQPYHLYYFERESLTYLLQDCGFKIMQVAYQEPFSGWVNTIIHTALGTSRLGMGSVRTGTGHKPQSGKAKTLLRDGFEVTRLIAGGLLLPLRMAQSSVGKGEELIILASPLCDN